MCLYIRKLDIVINLNIVFISLSLFTYFVTPLNYTMVTIHDCESLNNPYTTDIRNYEFLEAMDEEWDNLFHLCFQEWLGLFENKDEDKIAEIFIEFVKNCVKKYMRKKGINNNESN